MTDTDWTPDTEAAVLELLRLGRVARVYAADNVPSSGSDQDQMLAQMRDAPPAALAHALAMFIADVSAKFVGLSLFPDDARPRLLPSPHRSRRPAGGDSTMSDHSGIEWTDATWNPTVGCTKVSPGCDHCYAETLVNRFAGHNSGFPNRFDVMTLRDERFLTQPLRWTKPRRIFVNSLSDLFHDDVPDEFIARVFAVMAAAPQHTFQLLTKRHGRMRSLLNLEDFDLLVADAWSAMNTRAGALDDSHTPPWPLPNVWLGVTIENQQWADIRVPALLDTPAAVRFLSCEPLLGPVDLASWLPRERCLHCGHDEAAHYFGPGDFYGRTVGCQDGDGSDENPVCGCRKLRGEREHNVSDPYRNHGLHWVIAGGESGPGARPMHSDWARSLRDQCQAAGVPFLFKQHGEWAPGSSPRGERQDAVVARDTGEWLTPPHRLWVEKQHTDTENRRGWAFVHRAGKKAAGRELDGRTWDEYPTAVTP